MLAPFFLCATLGCPPSPLTIPDPMASSVDLTDRSWVELQDPKPRKPRKFPRLTAPNKKRLQDALLLLRTAKTEESLKEAQEGIQAIGAAGVPSVIKYYNKLEEEHRVIALTAAFDKILTDEDLELAWKALGKKPHPAARNFLARRWAFSEREDSSEWLLKRLDDPSADVVYLAALGLARRGDTRSLKPLRGSIQSEWKHRKTEIRADFQDLERGPLSAATVPLIAGSTAELTAGLHLFELVGIEQHASILKRGLENSNHGVRAAAIDACRVVIDKDPPLKNLNAFEIAEKVQTWLQRLP